MTIIIAMLNQKGGVGKTTLTTHLGVAFKNIGRKTLLIDADPQGSLRDWNDANGGQVIPVLGMDRETLPIDINAVKKDYDIIIIDGAPQSSKLVACAVRVADIIFIPVSPSPYDVWACADLVDIIKARHQVTNGHPKTYFIISRSRKNTKLSHEITDALYDYGFPIIKQCTTHREIYPQTASEGQTVYHVKEAKEAILEIDQLLKEILEVCIYA